MKTTFREKIPHRWEWLLFILPYLLLGSTAIWVILFCRSGAGLHPVQAAYEKWVGCWPEYIQKTGFLVVGITLLLLFFKAHRSDWFWGWLGITFFFAAYLLTDALQVSFSVRYPGATKEIFFWISIIFVTAFLAHKAMKLKRAWIWPALFLPALAFLYRLTFRIKYGRLDIYHWDFIQDILGIDRQEGRMGFSIIDRHPIWKEFAIVSVFLILVVWLIRKCRVRPEKIFLFSFSVLLLFWLMTNAYYNESWIGIDSFGYSKEALAAQMNQTAQIPLLLPSIPWVSSLIALLPALFILFFLKQKKWRRRWVAFSLLVILQFIVLRFFPITLIPSLARAKEVAYMLPTPFGSKSLGLLLLLFHSYLDACIIVPLMVVSGPLLASSIFLTIKKAISRRPADD